MEAKQNHRLRCATIYLNWLKKQPSFLPHIKQGIKETEETIKKYEKNCN